MIQFQRISRWAWSILVVCTLAFAMGGCEGDDGAQGPQGPAGDAGPQGDPGVDATVNPVVDAVAAANVESCNVCHEGVGGFHQAVYNEAVDASRYVLTIDDLRSTPNNGAFDVELDFTVTLDNAPYTGLVNQSVDGGPGLALSSWQVVEHDSTTGAFPQPSFELTADNAVSNGDGTYTLSQTVAVDPLALESGAIVGRIGDGRFEFPDNLYVPTAGKRVEVYEDLTTDAYPIGNINTYQSLANVAGCQRCHGTPYRKHGNTDAVVDGVPDFARCKTCHYTGRTPGFHPDWQYMVDDPEGWATGADPQFDYSYVAELINVVHMSHSMEFPYPQSMANCVTCHEGNLTEILDDSNFTAKTCKSCHVVNGINAWPEDPVTGPAGDYAQPHRPPPLKYLWARLGDIVVDLHDFADINTVECTLCHGDSFPGFSDYHTGYDESIYDENGNRYATLNSVSVDSAAIDGDLLTVNFSATNADIVPTLAISFYGWDTKHYLVAAHDRDANSIDCPHSRRPGCNIEWSPGSTKPFFTEEAASAPGAWVVTFDMSLYQAYKTNPIPQLIGDGDVKYAEIAVLPRLDDADGDPLNLEAVTTTFDLGAEQFIPDYYQGANATVAFENCQACHDNVTTLVHTGSGRFGDSMQTCKACHATTFPGSHLEMQSRSIDSYVHAIHRFQPLDEDAALASTDPVFIKRNEMHKEHTLPYFTSLACEACHVAGKYNVADQAKSMPGVKSGSWEWQLVQDDDLTTDLGRAIGEIPEAVQGASSRACGSCHRAEWIKKDHAGDLAAFDAHTGAFGTLVDNDPTDANEDDLEEEPVLFGIIYKIQSLFK